MAVASTKEIEQVLDGDRPEKERGTGGAEGAVWETGTAGERLGRRCRIGVEGVEGVEDFGVGSWSGKTGQKDGGWFSGNDARVEAHGSAREAGADGVEGVEGDEAPGASRLEGKDWLSGKTVLEKEVVPWPRRIWSASLGISVSPPRRNSRGTTQEAVATAKSNGIPQGDNAMMCVTKNTFIRLKSCCSPATQRHS